MSEDRLSRLAPLSGVLFVVLELAGFAIGSAGGRSTVSLSDPTSKIVNAFADPVSTGAWVGAYMELVSLAAFAVFAAWLFKARPGALATAGLLGASAYIALTAVSLVIGDVLAYRAGHGIREQEILTLFTIQSGLFFTSWGIAGGILAVAPVTGWLRRSALAIAALSFIAMAFPKADPAQFPQMLFLIWVVAASIAMVRSPERAPAAVPAATHA
jgi:hypothetical protein